MVLSNEALHAIMVEAGSRMKIREHLSASGLLRVVRSGFEKIVDTRAAELVEISLADTLMSAFAMFSLKAPSLLAFDKRRQTDDNLRTVYGIEQVPCDTQMRTTLDQVSARFARGMSHPPHRMAHHTLGKPSAASHPTLPRPNR